MAEQEKQTGQAKEVIAEQKLNRQVNYFIMRRMWQVIRGRSADDTIYKAFETSRERFTRVINTGVIRYGKGELAGLCQLTGLSEYIFTGKKRFECSYKDGDKEQSITREEWVDLFKWRETRNSNEDDKQKRIYTLLNKVNKQDEKNPDFYRLCYFLKERKPAPIRLPSSEIRDVMNAINSLSFDMLDGCEPRQLVNLIKLMRSKLTLADSIRVYKEAQGKSTKTDK